MQTHTPDPGWDHLLSDAGRVLLDEATADHAGGASLEQINRRLRAAGTDPGLVAATLTMVKLRTKAQLKFGPRAPSLLFTPAGLEQASRNLVAAEHARRFVEAQVHSVADLGCGIGAESMAFLSAGLSVRAVEIDAYTAEIARHNLHAVNAETVFEVHTGDAQRLGTADAQAAFFDPARRTSGHRDTKRVTSPNDYAPSLTYAFDVASRLPTGIKLGPGFDHELIPSEAEAQWVSVNGSVVETALWFGTTRRPGIGRSALLMTQRGDSVTRSELSAATDSPDVPTGDVEEYLYEPDGAVIRARLIGLLGERLDARMIDPHIAYMTSATLTHTPFAQTLRVIDEISPREKDLKKEMKKRGIGRLEIKKRGVGIDPAQLRQRLALSGNAEATLVMTRVGDTHRAFLCERVTSPAQ